MRGVLYGLGAKGRRMEAIAEPLRVIGAGIAYTAAYAFGIALFAWMARRRGLATEGVRIVVIAGVAGGLAGAMIGQLLFGGTGGKTILGGIAGGFLAVVLAKRSIGLKRPIGDLFAVALAGGEAVGRIGCFIGGCCYGKIASVPWAVEDHGAWRHPTQLYSSACAALTLAVLLRLEKRANLPENALFYIQGMLMCLSRFASEFFREPGAIAGAFTVAQWACLAGLAFFGLLGFRLFAPFRRPAFA
jgi:phosphatidylglycerol:prolipoprotein diacylglycerol transferase